VKLNDTELKVLTLLVSGGYVFDEPGFLHFRDIAKGTKLERKAVRRACHSLARKGFARYQSGLFTEDGDLYGAGYAATQAGIAFIEGVAE